MIRLAFAFCLLPLPLLAQDQSCFDGTQQEMNACTYAAWQAADAELNAVYADIIAGLMASDAAYPPEGKSEEERLRIAQRAWVAYRDANCDVAGYPMRGGSAEPLLINECYRTMTEDRIIALISVAKDY
ncbi:MAG: lysozyme inhibitor LprI family protein [Paracoccaceae bacterium]